jgi:hypothetical protein
MYFSAHKIHIFVTAFSSLTLLTRGIEKFKIQRVGCDMRLHSWVLQGVPYKGEIQSDNAGAKAIYTSSRYPHYLNIII